MALPINIEDLLNKRKVESNRLELRVDGILTKFTVPSVLLQPIRTIQAGDIFLSAWSRMKTVLQNVR